MHDLDCLMRTTKHNRVVVKIKKKQKDFADQFEFMIKRFHSDIEFNLPFSHGGSSLPSSVGLYGCLGK